MSSHKTLKGWLRSDNAKVVLCNAQAEPGASVESVLAALADAVPAEPKNYDRLLEAMGRIADVRSDGTMPGVVEAFERRGEIARGVIAEAQS